MLLRTSDENIGVFRHSSGIGAPCNNNIHEVERRICRLRSGLAAAEFFLPRHGWKGAVNDQVGQVQPAAVQNKRGVVRRHDPACRRTRRNQALRKI